MEVLLDFYFEPQKDQKENVKGTKENRNSFVPFVVKMFTGLVFVLKTLFVFLVIFHQPVDGSFDKFSGFYTEFQANFG